jgi:hypothetical protein
MMRDELLTRLLGLLPAQFDVVLFRVRIPPEYLAGPSAPQATRATEIMRYLEQQNQFERLARILEDVAPAGTAADRRRPTAGAPLTPTASDMSSLEAKCREVGGARNRAGRRAGGRSLLRQR